MFVSALFATVINAEVHQLTVDNFKKFIEENDNTLVKFYAPWCGHCKNMAPEYVEASNIIESAKLAEVDVTVEAALGEEYGIKGFPTLKYFSKGSVLDYEGGRTKKDFVNYIDMMSSDPVTAVDSLADAQILADNGPVFLAKCKKDSEEFKMWNEMAAANRSLGKFLSLESGDNEILVMDKNVHNPVKFSNKDETLLNLRVEKLPLFGKVSGENFSSYMETGLDLVWYAGGSSDYDAVQKEVEKTAKHYRGQFNFVFLDSMNFAKQIEGMLGLTTEQLPKMVRTQTAPGKFMLDESVTQDNIMAWMNKIESGALKPVLKSEDLPEDNSGNVKVVVGKNFEEIVTEDKDVVLMIHAPWCGHCKKLMPEFETAAAEIAKKSPETVLAVLDGTANELATELYPYKGFPTVFFKKAGSNTPQVFPLVERNANEILKFLSTNVKKPFKYEAPIATEDDDEL